ncbi:MAG: hypothetical protein LUD02_00435 [Tannerellaceae bacterium]|nr:hypothetical protein [Tannerellaceae bacterium]
MLEPYEDWRLPAEERARDLAQQMTIEQIAGLMLYSGHQAIPAGESRFAAATYQGKPFSQSGVAPWTLTDQQKEFLEKDNLRHILITSVQDPATAARWNNEMQAFVEGIGLGIPGNTSSDPPPAIQDRQPVIPKLNSMQAQADKSPYGPTDWAWPPLLILN